MEGQEKRIEIYKGVDGEVVFDVDAEGETIWATHEQMASIFGVDRSVIVRHVNNIYRDGELEKSRTCAKNAQVRKEGKRIFRREVDFFNLDVIEFDLKI